MKILREIPGLKFEVFIPRVFCTKLFGATKCNVYAGYGVYLTVRRHFWTKRPIFVTARHFICFSVQNFLPSRILKPLGAVLSTGLTKLCENKTMLPILLQISKPNCTSLKFFDLRGKKEAWTFLSVGCGEFVARFWSLVLRVLKQQGSKVYGVKNSSTGWSKYQTFWRLGIWRNFSSC